MLNLMYITKEPSIAEIVQGAGVSRIFVDMEYINKDIRQAGLDTVKNHHTISDVQNVRGVLSSSELLVRVNPIHGNSKQEIDSVIESGADIIMLPMWKTPQEVSEFIGIVGKRAKTMLLLETKEALTCLEDVVNISGIDEIHIGLNDLHLSLNKKFLFELLADGTVDSIAEMLKKTKIPFGFGGFGRIGEGLLPAQLIVAEHYRLGSSMAILSRSFCDLRYITDKNAIEQRFISGIKELREYEKYLADRDESFFEASHLELQGYIEKIIGR